MIELKKDKNGKTYILTTTDSEGFHRQVNLTEEDIDRLAAECLTASKNGNHVCIACGGRLCWDSDHNLPDEDDDEGIVRTYRCTTCGRTYKISDPPREEKETQYKEYWQDWVS